MNVRHFIILATVLLCAPALGAGKATLAQTFKHVGGAVVQVRTIERVSVARNSMAYEVSSAGLGSGVLVSSDGKVLTAAHVVQAADTVAVELPDGVVIRATILASEPAADLALLQLERVPHDVRPAILGDSDKVEIGDEIFVVGAPFGISHTLTVGHVSARRQPNSTVGGMEAIELFQTDAAINQGNSGGPMFNRAGEVVGIVSHIVSRSGGSEGLGFVVTSNMAQRLLFQERTVWSGVVGYLLTEDLARAFNVPDAQAGLLVQRVAHGSLAERLGLRGGNLPARVGADDLLLGGDIVVSVDDIALGTRTAYEDVRKRLIEVRDGDGSLRVTVLRAGILVDLAGIIEN